MRIYEPKKILVPIDFSEISPGILQAGVDIGKKWDAEVLGLHVARESEHIPPGAYHPYAEHLAEKFREDARTRLEGLLEDMLRKAGGGPRCKYLLLWGEPVRDILQMAENGSFDLIVMATHGRRGLNRMLMGSVTEQVIRRAPCPVFAIRIKKELTARAAAEAELAAMK